MTSDLTNQGVGNVSVTNNGATVDNSGKIGKCYYFDGNDHIRISLPSELTTIKNTTVCAWIKSTGSVIALGGISNDTNYANAMVTLYTSGWQFSSSGTYKYLSSGLTANDGVWHHVACTIDDTTITTYKDGVKVASNTLSGLGVAVTDITSANFIEIGCDHPGGDEYLTGYVNDFRIYNHALSHKEIEILSRGLVLHYPLSLPMPNLLPHTTPSYGLGYMSSYGSGTVAVDSTELFCGNSTIRIQPTSSNTSSGGTNYYNSDSVKLTSGVKYCYSCWIKSTVDDTFTTGSLGHFQTVTSSAVHNRTVHFEGMEIPANKWTQVYIVFTPTADCSFRSFFIYFANTSQKIWVSKVKLEQGDHPTPYCPGSGDTEYSSMGFNDTMEYDVSGNNYHSTYTSLPTYDSSSARYETSTYFGTTGNPNTSLINTSWLPTLTNGTISWWFKYTTGNSLPFTSDSGTHYIAAGASGTNLYDSNIGASGITMYKDGVVVNTRYEKSGSSDIVRHDNVRYNANEWHHFCLTGINLSTWTDFKINAYGSWHLRGYLSDVRIYATALTADQVQELYNTSASISNNGTLLGYELVES